MELTYDHVTLSVSSVEPLDSVARVSLVSNRIPPLSCF
jgi:hypothetical protein